MSVLSFYQEVAPGRLLLAAVLLASALLTACDKDETPTVVTAPPPEKVVFTQANLYPEGVQYDPIDSRFLVSSQTAGAVGQVKDDGNYAVFADNSALVSSIGMSLDVNGGRNRLLVAVSDPGYNLARTSTTTRGKLARLVIFNRNSPQSAPTVHDLGSVDTADNYPAHFANDITVDREGNAYVTDSFAPVIYKITAAGVVSVFAEDARLGAPAGAFGLNGIVWHPDGYLLVAKSNTGTIFKIPTATPKVITVVGTGAQSLQGADGLQLGATPNSLQVVCNAQAKLFLLNTTDNWSNASVTGTFVTPPQYPTTLAYRPATAGGEVGSATYVLYSNLNALQTQQSPPVSAFTIARVNF